MNQENSSFGTTESPTPFFTETQQLNKNGATSDTSKVRLFGKWHFLKRPKKEFATNPVYLAAFEKEFDLGFQLDHPNIVRYHSKGADNEGFYMVTEYVEGLNLSEFRTENPNCFKDKRFVKKIVLQILSALDYLHNNQIIHLDLKPENILITGKGQNVKLIDLGFSSSDGYDPIACGTPEFSSPEQFGNPTTTDARNDIYAFGNVLIYMFTGNILPRSIGKLPQPYRKISIKCTREDPLLRYSNISGIIRQIEFHQKKKIMLASISGVLVFILLFGYGLQSLKRDYILSRRSDEPVLRFDEKRINAVLDSTFGAYDKEFPKIGLSNIYEAGIRYNAVLSNLYKWKEKQLMANELTVRPQFEIEFNRIWNVKTTRYYELFNQIQLSLQTQTNSEETKLRTAIRKRLDELYQPLNDYK